MSNVHHIRNPTALAIPPRGESSRDTSHSFSPLISGTSCSKDVMNGCRRAGSDEELLRPVIKLNIFGRREDRDGPRIWIEPISSGDVGTCATGAD